VRPSLRGAFPGMKLHRIWLRAIRGLAVESERHKPVYADLKSRVMDARRHDCNIVCIPPWEVGAERAIKKNDGSASSRSRDLRTCDVLP